MEGIIDITNNDSRLGVLCLICNESVDLTEDEEISIIFGHTPVKICNECRKAILRLRGLTTEGECNG